MHSSRHRRTWSIEVVLMGVVLMGAATLGACSSGVDSATDVPPASDDVVDHAARQSGGSERTPSSTTNTGSSGSTPDGAASDGTAADGTGDEGTTVASSSSTSTTAAPTTVSTTLPDTTTPPPPPPGPAAFDLDAPSTTIGHSLLGQPIVAERVGEPGGRPVVVIGVIHGDEDAGVAVIDELRTRPPPDGTTLWLIESMNPDGQAAQQRGNAGGVDLNRNFPHNWGPIGEPGDAQYAGPGPASEPETQSLVTFLETVQPDVTMWYHQDLFTVTPSTGREGRVRARYAELAGLPMDPITGGTYTGVAATWARNRFGPQGGVAFIVELGPTLSADEAAAHAVAVLAIAGEP